MAKKQNKFKYLDKLPEQLVDIALPKALFKNKVVKQKFVDAFTKEMMQLKANPEQVQKPVNAAAVTIMLLKDVFTKHEDVAKMFGKKNIIEMLDKIKELYNITEAPEDMAWLDNLADEDTDEEEPKEDEQPESEELESKEDEQPESEEVPDEGSHEEEINGAEHNAPGEGFGIDNIDDFDPDSDEDMEAVAKLFIKALGLDELADAAKVEESVGNAAEMLRKIRNVMQKDFESKYTEALAYADKQNAALMVENQRYKKQLEQIRETVKSDIKTVLLANMPEIIKEAKRSILESTGYDKYINMLRALTEMINRDAVVLADENVKMQEELEMYKTKYQAATALLAEAISSMSEEEVNADATEATTGNENEEGQAVDENGEPIIKVDEVEATEELTDAVLAKKIGTEVLKENPDISEDELAEAIANGVIAFKVGKILVEEAGELDDDTLADLIEHTMNYLKEKETAKDISDDNLQRYVTEALVLRKLVTEGAIDPNMSDKDIISLVESEAAKILDSKDEQVLTE